MKFGIFFRIKFRNCTKSGKANAEIFSKLPWNNFRIWQYFLNKGGSFRPKFGIPNFFPRSIRSIRTILKIFSSSFGVFGQFRIFFRAHSEYSDNSELISELYAENIWKFIKILFFHENIFFLIRKSQNTPNSIFRTNIWNLLLRVYCYIIRIRIR